MMRRTVLVVPFVLIASAGCTDANPALAIVGNIIGEAEMGVCNYSTDGALLLRGTFNRDVGVGYVANPLFLNQARSRPLDITADPNGAQIRGAEVTLLDEAGNQLAVPGPNPFLVTTSVFVPSGDGEDPGQQIGSVELIPSTYRVAVTPGTTVVATVQAFGENLGGRDVETDKWYWPIDICDGNCLLRCSIGVEEEIVTCLRGQDFASLDPCGCDLADPMCFLSPP